MDWLTDKIAATGRASRFFVRLSLLSIASLRRPRLIIDQIHFIGNYSLSIILVSGLLIGFVLGLQGYYTLRRYGSE
ncbi:MAG: ABC transporter permease, partial [Betaproteobacteria bacterium]